ncbi:MAG: hypothetical protein ACREX0_09015 [Noviherbaspirillum sp.]
MTTIDATTLACHDELRRAADQQLACTAIALPAIALHPLDYRLLEQAIAINGYDIGDFVRLVVYRASRAVIEDAGRG